MPTVLVVEDEALIRMMVALSLSDDYEVIEATNALQGLVCLSRPSTSQFETMLRICAGV